jgi:hypothetical protein
MRNLRKTARIARRNGRMSIVISDSVARKINTKKAR